MRFLAKALILALSISSTGCSHWKWWEKPQPLPQPSPDAKYEQLDLVSLVSFGGDMVRMAEAERMVECGHLQSLVGGRPLTAFRLRLALVEIVTASCGSLDEAQELLRHAKADIKDAHVVAWVGYIEELVVALRAERSARKDAEGKVKKVRASARRNQRQALSKDTELKALKNKLDALKSIEQGLGGAQGEQ